jgi:hypothetical protein
MRAVKQRQVISAAELFGRGNCLTWLKLILIIQNKSVEKLPTYIYTVTYQCRLVAVASDSLASEPLVNNSIDVLHLIKTTASGVGPVPIESLRFLQVDAKGI